MSLEVTVEHQAITLTLALSRQGRGDSLYKITRIWN